MRACKFWFPFMVLLLFLVIEICVCRLFCCVFSFMCYFVFLLVVIICFVLLVLCCGCQCVNASGIPHVSPVGARRQTGVAR